MFGVSWFVGIGVSFFVYVIGLCSGINCSSEFCFLLYVLLCGFFSFISLLLVLCWLIVVPDP